ncbi:ATP-binding protein [Bacillus sp. 1P06AnD]|uniref:ATP-binding protein n=1 Tax=Bacillus sp. 1P06AnD TaxID=3132208 RepID=UPI0039A2ABB1
MDDIKAILNRNHTLANLIWIIVVIQVLYNAYTQQSLLTLDILVAILLNGAVTILNKYLNKPYIMMYGIVALSILYTFITAYNLPYISNYIFIMIPIIIAAFYQVRRLLIITAILSVFLQWVLFIEKGNEILRNTMLNNYIHIFIFVGLTFFILFNIIHQTDLLKHKNQKKESKAKEDLHSTKSLYESLFSYSKDAIAILNPQGKIIEFNQAFLDLYDIPTFSLDNALLQTFFPDSLSAVEQALDQARSGNSVIGLELQSKKLSNESLIVEMTISPIFNVHSQMDYVSCMIRDVTEKRLMEDYLRNSEKLKVTGEIAAGVAHEIRNPLTVISGFIQMLNEENSPHKQYLDIITSEIKRMNSIISEFLVLSKPHVSNVKMHNLQSLLKEVILLFQSEAHYKGVTISAECKSVPFLVFCEGNQMKQVFINLLKNSFEAMPDGGAINITCKEQMGNEVLLTIEDTGIGIPETVLSNIGKPFFTTKETGTGLGFMITERIIQQHNGTIDISSTVGKGTTINITLPFERNNTPQVYLNHTKH